MAATSGSEAKLQQNVPLLPTSQTIDMAKLRRVIPSHCFQPSYATSITYLLRDLILVIVLTAAAFAWIPTFTHSFARIVAWLIYGWFQGLVFTGIWVLGHECGHGAFLKIPILNDLIGFVLHSLLLTPYFSWKITHRRHHRYTGHMDRDNNHVPLRKEEYLKAVGINAGKNVEDAPLYMLFRLLIQQTLGWPLYLLCGITGGPDSTARPTSSDSMLTKNHFNPRSALFRSHEATAVVISDLGILATVAILWYAGLSNGFGTLSLIYGQPFIWLNQWVVTVTYLQHTHPQLPRYESRSWTFVKGATSTIDRDFGFIGRFFLHNVIDYHVVHHLFPRIPFYYGEEATHAIRPLLGVEYHEDRRGYMNGLWEVYKNCQYVAADSMAEDDRRLWFRAGKMPPLFKNLS